MGRLYGPGPGDPPPLVPTQDLAGLRTTDVEDRPVGALFGSLSEKTSGLIRYLDVDLEGADKHVLVPIGHTRIDTDGVQPRVRLRVATYEDLLSVPAYNPDSAGVDAAFQERLMSAYGQLYYGERYYAHPSFDHRAVYAGGSLVVSPPGTEGEPVEPDGSLTVQPLSRWAGRTAGPELDLVGRAVDDAGGETVGEVVELLVEVAARSVRYAVVDLLEPARSTVLPIGYLQASAAGDRLVTRALTRDDIRLLPPYDGPLTREQENRIHAALEGRLSGERYFQRPDFRGR
jgi:hypothetical protein